MDVRLEQFRAGAAKVKDRRAGRKFGKELIALGGEFIRSRRSEGASTKAIAGELGIAEMTVRRWGTEAGVGAGEFKPVHVIEAAPAAGFSVTLGSLRVEGLTLEGLIALAKALS